MPDRNPEKTAPGDFLPSYGGLSSALTPAAAARTRVPESFRALLGLGHGEVGDEKVIELLWLGRRRDLTSVTMDTEEKMPANPITGV
jgi:hypothetical protein